MLVSSLRRSCWKRCRVLSGAHMEMKCHRVFFSSTEKSDKSGRRKRPPSRPIVESSSVVEELFVPRDANRNQLDADEYHATTLSPWVPTPDVVIWKALDLLEANVTSVHYDLGCGDGRFNFHAHHSPYSVQKTIGIDYDGGLIDKALHTLRKIRPIPDNIEFHCMDLRCSKEDHFLWKRMSHECTIATMFFVEHALQILKPELELAFSHRDFECRILTVGYPMKGWEPRWIESIMGLPLHLYILGGDTNTHSLARKTPC